MVLSQKRNKGRFIKGVHYSESTEFKTGSHWRNKKLFWDKDWLETEYIVKGKSTSDIAKSFQVGDTAIQYWLEKHGIARRNISEARKLKRWGAVGKQNPMYNKRGALNPNWKNGASPERQSFYATREWKKVARAIRVRDNFTCRRCGVSQKGLHIHHIKSFCIIDYRFDPANLVLLCKACHSFVHSKENVIKEFC